MRPLIAGNWKMNGLTASLAEIEAVALMAEQAPPPADLLICPPATLISRAATVAAGRLAIGGQDCHGEVCGAYTGDIAAQMLKDAGASAVILGHSERRHFHGETDDQVAAKTRAAWAAGLMAIVCVGETEAQRDDGEALNIVGRQIAGSLPQGAGPDNTAIAYEPVWAIGTGRTPTLAEIGQMHAHIRKSLGGGTIRILYGGSVKPANAREILAVAEVGGALVGGASLKARDFHAIFSSVAPKA